MWRGWLIMLMVAGCATPTERELDARWVVVGESFASEEKTGSASFDGTLQSYRVHALSHHPELKGEHAMWSARMSEISRGRRLPDPELMVDVMAVARHEVGLMMLGLSQEIPWPGRLEANVASASAQALAQEKRLQAMASDVTQMVTGAYWPLWRVRRVAELQKEHLTLVRGLAETVRGRVAVGNASVADLQQIELEAARLEDELVSLAEEERVLASRLVAALGGAGGVGAGVLSTAETPRLRDVEVTRESLVAALAAHPRLETFVFEAAARDEAARAEQGEGMPHLMVDSKWLFDEGTLTLGGSVSLPIWRSDYADAADAMSAEAVARRFARQATYDASLAEMDEALSQIRDTARRARLVGEVLIPQADAVYGSLLAAYASGQGTVAQLMLTQRDLLDLRILVLRVQVEHELAWSKLENLVGTPVLMGEETSR